MHEHSPVSSLYNVLALFRYSNGDVYDGHWSKDKRDGFGRLEEASRKNSTYCGGWLQDKQHGYGVYDDRLK